MPLWVLYHPTGTFTDQAEKQALVNRITKIYHLIPRFMVDILFVPVEPSSYFCGNVPRPSPHNPEWDPQPKSDVPHIRITIQHIARTL